MKLIDILKEAIAQKIYPDDIKVGAQFKFKDPNNGEIEQIEITKILSDWNGESIYFKYLDRGNKGPYLLGDPDKVVDFLNKSFGEKIQPNE